MPIPFPLLFILIFLLLMFVLLELDSSIKNDYNLIPIVLIMAENLRFKIRQCQPL